MNHSLASLLDIRPGEGRTAALGLAASFGIGAALLLLYASSRAIFLDAYASGDLAYVYVGVALAGTALGLCFSLLERRLPRTVLVSGTLALLALSLAGFWAWLRTGDRGWAPLLLAVWFDVCFILAGLAFWGLMGSLLDVRQAKRLFGLLGSGEFLATLLAGLAAPFLARTLGPVNLLLPAAAALLASAVLAAALARQANKSAPPREIRPPAAARPRSRRNGVFVPALHLLWAAAIAGLFLTDMVLNIQAQAHAADAAGLAGFFGRFYALAAALVLALRALVSGRAIARLGAVGSLALLPAALAAATIAVILCAGALPQGSPAVFWLAVSYKLVDYVLRYSAHKPAFMVLYQPLPAERRLAVQASVEGLAEPAAILGVGLALLAQRSWLPLDTLSLSYLLLGVLALWLGALLLVRRGYRRTLLDAVRTRRADGELSLQDRQSVALIARRLGSADPGEVLSGMALLAANAPEVLAPELPGLADHPARPVALEALARMAEIKPAGALAVVQRLLRTTRDPEVTAAALRALGALSESEALEALNAYLADRDPRVVSGAMVALIQSGGIEGVLAAGERLMRMRAATDPAERETAARTLGDIGIPGYYRPLADLLLDPAPQVRAAALAAAERLGNPRLAHRIIANLGQGPLRRAAVRTLATLGQAVLPEIEAAFADPEQSRRVRADLLLAAARIPGDAPLRFLDRAAALPDSGLRLTALESLAARGRQAASREERRRILDRLAQEARAAARLVRIQAGLRHRPEAALLARALGDEVGSAKRRLLALLAFLAPPGTVARTRTRLDHRDRGQQALALELLEELTPAEARRAVLPFFSGQGREDLPRAVAHLAPEPLPAFPEMLAGVLAADDALSPWTRTTALHAAGLLGDPGLRAAVAAAPDSGEAAFAETRAFALARLDRTFDAPPGKA